MLLAGFVVHRVHIGDNALVANQKLRSHPLMVATRGSSRIENNAGSVEMVEQA